jgi:hypothetical protein
VQAPPPFRRANEVIARAAAQAEAEAPIDFICECADEDCLAPVRLTLEAYRRARDGGEEPVTAAGHTASPVEVASRR